jgi:septal ring factor EnvC (AmiA/AmiB activator)
MIKPMLILSLFLAIPTASERAKPPKQELIELRDRVKSLEDLVAEQQDRLQTHKIENDSLKRRVSTLESRITALEEAIAGQMPPRSSSTN